MNEFKLPTRLEPVMNDKSRHQVVVAHRRWAKTLLGVSKCIVGSKHHAGALTKMNSIFWIVFSTYKQAKLAAWKMLKDKARETGHLEAKPNETELKVQFRNGSEVHLKGSENPDLLRGGGLDGCDLDEWALQDPVVWTEIIRPALADKRGWSLKTFTPKGMNHAYTDFVNSGKKHFYPADKTGVIPIEELAEMQKEMSQDEYAQEMLCQFLYYAGQIYKHFKDSHIIEPFDIDTHFQNIIGIDYGLRNPTAIEFGKIDYDGNLYWVDEIYESGKEVKYFADLIKAKMGNQDYVAYIDPSTAKKDRIKNGVPYSIYQEFLDNGIRAILANSQVLAGINKVNQMNLADQIFYFPACEHLIEQKRTYRWREHKAKDVNLPEEPMKVNDHAVDSERYGVATYFTKTERPPKPVIKYTDEWYELTEKKQYGKKKVLI